MGISRAVTRCSAKSSTRIPDATLHYAWSLALIRAIDQREPTLRGCLSPCAIAFEVTRPEPRRAPFDGDIALTVGAVGETMLAMARNPGQERFNRWAHSYDRSILQRFLFEPVHDAVLGAFSELSVPPCDVLDVGCGTGRLLESAAARWNGARFTGVDASVEMVAEARRKHEGDFAVCLRAGGCVGASGGVRFV